MQYPRFHIKPLHVAAVQNRCARSLAQPLGYASPVDLRNKRIQGFPTPTPTGKQSRIRKLFSGPLPDGPNRCSKADRRRNFTSGPCGRWATALKTSRLVSYSFQLVAIEIQGTYRHGIMRCALCNIHANTFLVDLFITHVLERVCTTLSKSSSLKSTAQVFGKQ